MSRLPNEKVMALVGTPKGAFIFRGGAAGVDIGTSTGQLFHKCDEGRKWLLMADFMPQIYSVEAFRPYD